MNVKPDTSTGVVLFAYAVGCLIFIYALLAGRGGMSQIRVTPGLILLIGAVVGFLIALLFGPIFGACMRGKEEQLRKQQREEEEDEQHAYDQALGRKRQELELVEKKIRLLNVGRDD